MNINPSSIAISRNQQDTLRTKAQQVELETERSFARILGQLLVDREQSNSVPIDTLMARSNFSLVPNQISFIPIQNNANYPPVQSSGLQYTDQTINTNMDRLNSILGGKLKGTGQWFISAGKQYGINPALLASISMHETGNGSSKAAHDRNNISGTMTSHGLKNYSSIQESIMEMARNLRENYFNKGLQTIEEIGKKYAPVGASNDPTNLNQYWISQVTKNFNHLST